MRWPGRRTTVDDEQEAESLKKEGNQLFGRGKYGAAIEVGSRLCMLLQDCKVAGDVLLCQPLAQHCVHAVSSPSWQESLWDARLSASYSMPPTTQSMLNPALLQHCSDVPVPWLVLPIPHSSCLCAPPCRSTPRP